MREHRQLGVGPLDPLLLLSLLLSLLGRGQIQGVMDHPTTLGRAAATPLGHLLRSSWPPRRHRRRPRCRRWWLDKMDDHDDPDSHNSPAYSDKSQEGP
jgi:hypothetical protein